MAFNRDNRSSGTRDFGRRSFDGARSADREMFKAICSKCGKECEVPFRPTGSKPVYCRDCFRTIRDSNSGSSYGRGSGKPSFDNSNRGSSYPQYKEQFEAINIKLDKILKLLNPEKPIKTPKVAIEPQIKDEAIKVDIKPAKKKAKTIKLAPSEIPTE